MSPAEEYQLARELIPSPRYGWIDPEQVAERMHTKAPSVARLESGKKHSPSLAALRKYAHSCRRVQAGSPLGPGQS